MALIAALLPRDADRTALTAAAPGHRAEWAGSWRELEELVKSRPAAAVVADLHAERGKDGALRILRFSDRYPQTPILVWGDLGARDLYRLGKAGATEVILKAESSNRQYVAELLTDAMVDEVAVELDARLRGRIGEAGRALVASAAARIPDGVQVPDLAAAEAVSVSTLERRCDRWGLVPPGHLLLWLRIVYGLYWLMEPGRSVESVSRQLGYSSGAAFRRALKVTVGGRPTPLRNRAGLEAAMAAFVDACPGEPRPGMPE